jgi:hypothetical protein
MRAGVMAQANLEGMTLFPLSVPGLVRDCSAGRWELTGAGRFGLVPLSCPAANSSMGLVCLAQRQEACSVCVCVYS